MNKNCLQAIVQRLLDKIQEDINSMLSVSK